MFTCATTENSEAVDQSSVVAFERIGSPPALRACMKQSRDNSDLNRYSMIFAVDADGELLGYTKKFWFGHDSVGVGALSGEPDQWLVNSPLKMGDLLFVVPDVKLFLARKNSVAMITKMELVGTYRFYCCDNIIGKRFYNP